MARSPDEQTPTRGERRRAIFESRPFYKRVSFFATAFALLFSWVVDGTILWFAYQGTRHYSQFQQLSGIVLFASALLAVYLCWFTYQFLLRSLTHYEAAVLDQSVTLYIKPPIGYGHQVSVSAEDIDYIEHFTATDEDAFVCHLHNGKIVEIPLWAFPESAGAIASTLRRPGVRVLSL